MKKIILIFIISVLFYPGWAQKGLFEDLTGKYADNDGFSASRITSDMFDLYLKKRNIEKDSPVHEALSNLSNILVVSQNSYFNNVPGQNENETGQSNVTAIYNEILKHYQSNNYTLFKTEKQIGEDIKVFLKKDKDNIESLALVTHSNKVTNLIELQGRNIDLSTVSELNRALNLRGLENLYKINSPGIPGLYAPAPPVPPNEPISVIVEKHKELISKQHQLTDEQREKMKIQAIIMAEKQKELAEKYREMTEKYHRQPIFLSAPGDSVEYYINGKKVTGEEIKQLSIDNIERVEVNKKKGNKEKGTIRITTRD